MKIERKPTTIVPTTYTIIGDTLMMCTAVKSQKGEIVNLSASDKIILSFMEHRWHYFVLEKGGEYFDSLEFIAKRTGTNVKTVERCVAKLAKSEVLIAEKRYDNYKKHHKWYFKSFGKITFLVEDKDGNYLPLSTDVKDYLPTPHYKVDKVGLELNEIPVPPDNDYFVPYSENDYDNDYVVSMWEAGL